MSTTNAILPRDQVAERFSVSPAILVRYEARGLIRVTRVGAVEGYAPAEVRRIWTILSLRRDLGINLAGVEAILKLRAHIDEVHARMRDLADRLREAVEAPDDPGA